MDPIPFSSLPLDPAGPPGNAWGRFGPDDSLGMLNLLTPKVVAHAAREIRSGARVSLDLSLDKPHFPLVSGRQPFEHTIRNRPKGEGLRVINDDHVSFNTQ